MCFAFSLPSVDLGFFLPFIGIKSMASSSSNHQWIYDVFLSFRGSDIRHNLLDLLSDLLSNAGINAFRDDEKLERGEDISSALMGAIEGSRIALVVLSINYASSTWCLNELVKIMECRRTHGLVVIPIFYEVDPSDVRHQTGPFSFDLQEARFRASEPDLVLNWKTALTDVANLSGYDMSNFRSEAEALQSIVDDVLTKTDDTLPITEFPVGLDAQAKQVIEFIETQSNQVCIVGILGMGGLGKTTTAKAIYNQIYRQFQRRSFIENIREVCQSDRTRGHIQLQKQLLSDVLKTKEKIHSIAKGTNMIKRSLTGKKALVILDDVTTSQQLKALCGNREWFGSGSVIIVTTRDERVLKQLKADHVYRMNEMDKDKALELFSWHAFGEESPIQNFSELSINVVAYSGGLPLALEVLGSYLSERTEQEWRSVLLKLEKIPNDQVQEKLKISYDGLKDHLEKDIFLDICCFFIGKDRAYVTDILNGCELHADIGIIVLIERSLLKVDKNNKLGMHALIRDMGREIVCESSRKEPGKRSRLWIHKEAHDVLANNRGKETVEGLVLKMQKTGTVCFNANVFKEMKKLRLLQLVSVELAGDYGHLSKELTWVYWRGCAFKYIPDDFDQGNLVVMELKHSNLIQVWKEDMLLEKLKILNLSHSRYLKRTPDFSKLPNLEKLIMKDCPSLREIHQSIGELSYILLINLKDCTNLRNLPNNIYKLKSLRILNISGCSKIERLEEDIGQMESLTTLIAKDTAVKEVPCSVVIMESIQYISLCGYEGLSRDVFPSLTWSWILSQKMTFLFRTIPFRGMSSLRCVRIQCGSETQLEEFRRSLDDLHDVNLAERSTISNASQVSDFPLRSLLIGMGSSHLVIDTLGKKIAQGLASSDSYNIFLPGDNYPCWLAYTGEGPSVNFEVPDDSYCCMKGITLCVVYSSTPEVVATESLVSVLIINYTKFTVHIFKRDTAMSFNDEDWQGVISNLGPGDNVEIFVAFGHGLTVKETAIYLIYGESVAMEIEPSIIIEDEPSIKVNIKLLSQVNLLPSVNVEMEPSLEIYVQPSPNMEMEPSPEMNGCCHVFEVSAIFDWACQIWDSLLLCVPQYFSRRTS